MPSYIEWVKSDILPLNIQDYLTEEEALSDLIKKMNVIDHIKRMQKDFKEE
jgi:hypothetical protein